MLSLTSARVLPWPRSRLSLRINGLLSSFPQQPAFSLGSIVLAALVSMNVCWSAELPPDAAGQDQGSSLGVGDSNDRYRKGSWDWSSEFAYTFHVVPNPWHMLIDLKVYDRNPNAYEFVTQTAGLRYRLTDVSGPWFLRGSAQVCGDLVVTEIVRGPESIFLGSAFGLHYDFVQRGWPIVPYVDFRIGPGWIDATKGAEGQQNELEFTYLWGVGLRYDISSSLSVSVGAIDQHFSDAWLVHRNLSVDNIGVNIRLEKKF